jgi:hypothetical protein
MLSDAMLLAGVPMYPSLDSLSDVLLLREIVFQIVGMLSDAMLLANGVVFPIPETLPDAVLLKEVVFRIVGLV